MRHHTTKRGTKESTIFPSEQAGFVIRNKTIYEGWIEVLSHIEQFGKPHKNGASTKHLHSLVWIAEDESEGTPNCPHIPKTLQKNLSIAPEAILEYVKKHFLQYGGTQTSADIYGNRLCRWGGLFDQVDAAITALQESPDTKRAFLSTLIPSNDLLKQNEPPYLTGIQFLKNGAETLDVLAVFRSHDIFKTGLKNAFGILYLLRYVSNEAGIQRGRVIITSHDAHIQARDNKGVRQILRHTREKNSPTPSNNPDPRGSFRIYIKGSSIVVDCINSKGNLLQQFTGTDASEIYRGIVHHHLISQPEHGCYIGVQLARAEECLRRNLPFTQDKPIPA